MKKLFILVFLLCSIGLSAQHNGQAKISEEKIKNVKSLKEILPFLDACEIKSFTLTFSKNGHVKEFKNRKEPLDDETRQIFAQLPKGQKFFIEEIAGKCASVKKGYTVVVE